MSLETMTKLQTVTVGAGGQASVTFSNIPQNYTDLKIVASARSDRADTSDNFIITFNGVTTGYSYKYIQGSGATAYSGNSTTGYVGNLDASTATASTFGSAEFYIPNYTSNTYKSVSSDTVDESNNTNAYATLNEQLWSNPAAITSINFKPQVGSNFVQFSTFYLYGIKNAQKTAGNSIKATGGNIVFDGTYTYHTFLSSGNFSVQAPLTADYLVVAGGGSGAWGGGGGGAGGLRCSLEGTGGGGSALSKITLSPNTSYSVTVGAGGASTANTASSPRNGSNGTSSSIVGTGVSISTVGGGGGGGADGGNGQLGGSGGGSNDNNTTVGAGTTNEGYAGGLGGARGPASQYYIYAGGGGGAGGVGAAGVSGVSGGNGGVGFTTVISGVSTVYAGGGGSGVSNASATPGTGGTGGGGNGTASYNTTVNAFPGTANTGGGGGGSGGGSGVSGAGGSGIVIIRYKS